MFPRIAKCIIYHASHHLDRTFKMLSQYLELHITHRVLINRDKKPAKEKVLDESPDVFEWILS